ncbi:MAG: YtxH domain-containing protein [Actinomycetota bacterium]|nr:YtxH domain-containing protein [Actinomycetota bacterium]
MLDKQRLTTFVLGGVAGALAGILLAPKSGRELRGSIASRAGEARERGRETYFEAQERVQERLAESLERPRQRGETAPEQAGDPLPTLGSPTAPEPVLGYEPPAGAPAETSPETPVGATPSPPPLRDVSWDPPRQAPGEEPDPEEIRRKIQETRSRLRERLESPGKEAGPGDDPGDRDA